MIKLSPSILAADFTRLGEELKILKDTGVPYVHIDVMDGHFVPNISMGIPVIESIRRCTDMVLDVHLMISNPDFYIERFAKAGSDIINVHIEACEDIKSTIKKIRATGKKVGVTINPKTAFEKVEAILKDIDMLLIMSVEPGFGGQKFIYDVLEKLKKASEYVKKNNLDVDIEIDGGITADNVHTVLENGANVIVVGSAIFKSDNKAEEIKKLYDIFKEFEV